MLSQQIYNQRVKDFSFLKSSSTDVAAPKLDHAAYLRSRVYHITRMGSRAGKKRSTNARADDTTFEIISLFCLCFFFVKLSVVKYHTTEHMCFLVAYRPPKIEFTDQSLPYRAVLSCNKDAYMPHGALHQLCTLTFSLISLNWFSFCSRLQIQWNQPAELLVKRADIYTFVTLRR